MGHTIATFTVPTTNCPKCDMAMPAATAVDCERAVAPTVGDFSVCSHCATVLVYAEGLTLRAATDDDMAKLDEHTRVHLTIAKRTVASYRRAHGLDREDGK